LIPTVRASLVNAFSALGIAKRSTLTHKHSPNQLIRAIQISAFPPDKQNILSTLDGHFPISVMDAFKKSKRAFHFFQKNQRADFEKPSYGMTTSISQKRGETQLTSRRQNAKLLL
jgi:hypothetical protein